MGNKKRLPDIYFRKPTVAGNDSSSEAFKEGVRLARKSYMNFLKSKKTKKKVALDPEPPN